MWFCFAWLSLSVWFCFAWLSQFFLARVSRSTNVNPGKETGKQIVSARVGDVIIRSTDWRKTSQVRLPTSASRHYTHRKKRLSDFATRKEPLPLILAVGVSSRVKTFARKGAREGDGSAAMDTLSNRTFVTTPTRIHTFSLSHGATGSS